MLWLAVTWLVVFALVAVPVRAAHVWLVRRGVRDESLLLVGPLVAVGALGYATFFAFFLHPIAGQVVAFGSIGGLIVWLARRRDASPGPPSPLRHPAAFAFGLGLIYLGLLYLPQLGQPPEGQALFRFLYEFPVDANLPKLLGDQLYAGLPARDFLAGSDWLSSDRPPLQAGLYLLARPWLDLARLSPGLGYQCLGTLAQFCWVPAAWLLGHVLGFTRARSAVVVLTLGATGFALFNGTYVWPKLLAGGYVVMAALLLLDRRAPRSRLRVGLAAAAVALGWLSHGGVAFSVLPLALLLLLPRYFPGWKSVAWGAALFALLLLPWTAYQKFYDPPGNRLLKWHLAGVVDIDSRGVWECIRAGYAAQSREKIIADKLANYGVVLNGSFGSAFDIFTTPIRQRKIDEFFFVFRSLGVLNLAWVLAPLAWLWRRCRPAPPGLEWSLLLAAWALGSLVFWVLAIFIPATTIVHAGSYATMLALFLLAITLLLGLPRWLGIPVLAWHFIGFAATWLPYTHSAPLDVGMFGVIAAGALLTWLAFRYALQGRLTSDDLTAPITAARAFLRRPSEGFPWRPAAVTAVAAVAILLVRRPEAFLVPQFWAEDASVFFLQAEFMRGGALVQPYGGYHHFLLRLVAAAASGVDYRWIPTFYFWASIGIVVAVVLALFSPRLDLPHRPWLALAIVLVPHTGEVFDNLTNAQWVSALGLVWLLLARDPRTRWQGIVDLALAALIGLTGVFSILFAPLFFWRARLRRSRSAWTLAGVVLAAAVIQLVTIIVTFVPTGGESGMAQGIVRAIALRPWGTLLLPAATARTLPTPLLLTITVAGTILVIGSVRRRDFFHSTRCFIGGCALVVLLASLARYYHDFAVLAEPALGDRYFFLPKVLLLWLFILEWNDHGRWLARAACLMALWASSAAFRFVPYQDFQWPMWAARIRAGERTVVPINPGDSKFIYVGRPSSEK